MHSDSPSITPELMIDRSVNPRWEAGYDKGRLTHTPVGRGQKCQ